MGFLSAYLSLFSQPLVPPPDAAEDLESSSNPSSSSSSSAQAHHPHPSKPKAAEEYEPVELGTIPARPSMMFRARSSFMKMVGAARDAEAAGLNGSSSAGEGGGILGGTRERSGSKSYGSTGTTEVSTIFSLSSSLW